MTMESLGGDMPAGQPVAVSSGSRTHVFAIAKGGPMNHWISSNGGPWTGPSTLPDGNLAASIPCAIALADGSVYVFAIGMGGLFTGGPLTWWSSADGMNWSVQSDQSTQIPANGNGLAVASSDGQHIDAFASTSGGIIQYSIVGSQAVARGALPDSVGFPPRLLAAVSSAPGTLDVFAVESQLRHAAALAVQWIVVEANCRRIGACQQWHRSGLDRARARRPVRDHGRRYDDVVVGRRDDGRCQAVCPSTYSGRIVGAARRRACGRRARSKLDLFAIGQGGILSGGPLVHWRFDGTWREPEAYDSGLAAGGVGAVRSALGIDAFGIRSGTSNLLLHWPAGINGYGPDRWRNWAGNRETNPIEGHCSPTCLEELVEIVRTAAQQGKRVRAVGSSWSFGDIAVTPGYVVETNRLNKVLDTVLPAAQIANPTPVVPESIIPAPHHFIHVEAGIQLEDLMTHLDVSMMAPATMGGASGQTLAGVISTSVHGSHFRLPPISRLGSRDPSRRAGREAVLDRTSGPTNNRPNGPDDTAGGARTRGHDQTRRRLVRRSPRHRRLTRHRLLGRARGPRPIQAARDPHETRLVGAQDAARRLERVRHRRRLRGDRDRSGKRGEHRSDLHPREAGRR